MENTSRPRRLRRLDRIWSDKNSYFLTICTFDRKPVLACDAINDRLLTFLDGSPERYGVWIASYVLMPDHLHAIVTLSTDAVSVGDWVKALKSFISNREFQWQPSFFDHVLRSDESRSEKWDYIRMNPVRAALVERAEDWPYARAFHSITDDPVSRVTPPGVIGATDAA